MGITEKITSLAAKVEQLKSGIETEEATKNAFIMPFIHNVLGYNVFNPDEVIPEFTADVGTKKAEKIDYAIVKDGELQILIEAKPVGSALGINHASQLFRYFGTTNAKIALLTNGEQYHFYTDLERPNRMDEVPFMVFDLANLNYALIPELQKLSKASFDLASIINTAGELKYIDQIKRVLGEQFAEPDSEWLKALTARVYPGPITQKVRERFEPLVVKSMEQFLTDQVTILFEDALERKRTPVVVPLNEAEPEESDDSEIDERERNGIVTTEEELDGYQVVRAIACSEVAPARIVHRDTKSYMGILLDDNNRKPLVRLHFNTGQKYVGLFDEDKVETRYPVETVDDIYLHAEQIRKTAHYYG